VSIMPRINPVRHGTLTSFKRIYLTPAMRPVRSHHRLIQTGALLAIWTTYGLLSAWQTHYWYAFSKTPMTWGMSLKFELTYAYLWALATPLVVYLARRCRIERPALPRHLAVHFFVLIVLATLTKVGFDAIAMPPTSPFRDFTWPSLLRSIEQNLDTGALLYIVIVLLEHAFVYYRGYQQQLVNAANLQTQLAQAQLRALKMQLHPHFLFNTLHTITELVQEDPDLAERTIARLSELLRLFLANSTVHEVPLSEELRILNLYLEIERTRFEDRLSVVFDVPGELEDAMVPNLVLQPLVENAIRHGIGKRSAPGRITVSAERFNGTVVLRVADNGVGLSAAAGQTGMGLTITRGRLESLYGDAQSLVLLEVQTGGAEVRITLPFRLMESGETHNAVLQSSDRR
jgi:two-component system, LytTR family, sensor kinase